MSIWRKLCLSVGGILLGWGVGILTHDPDHGWKYEKTRSTRGYDYWTNTAGDEILVITVHHKKK